MKPQESSTHYNLCMQVTVNTQRERPNCQRIDNNNKMEVGLLLVAERWSYVQSAVIFTSLWINLSEQYNWLTAQPNATHPIPPNPTQPMDGPNPRPSLDQTFHSLYWFSYSIAVQQDVQSLHPPSDRIKLSPSSATIIDYKLQIKLWRSFKL